jgi:hypothetical protein
MLTAVAPLASANPNASPDIIVLGIPIFLVPLNYPINGLLLLSIYSVFAKGAQPRLSEGGRRFVGDFAAAVLLFTLVGAIVDFATWIWIDLYAVDDAQATGLIIVGLAAIAVSAYVVSSRYLGMTRPYALLAGCTATIVNLVAWMALILPNEISAFYICLPTLVVAYILFQVFLHRTRTNLMDRGDPEQGSGRVEIAMAKRSVERPSVEGRPINRGPRRRGELLIANIVSMVILILIALVFYGIVYIVM